MKTYKWILILLNLLLLLFYFNYSVAQKEAILKDGQLVLLALRPVDPRSLMQGDYMSLRYSISEKINNEDHPKRGYCVVRLNSKGIAEKVRLQKNRMPLNPGELLIEYQSTDEWNMNIGAESFFFEEGQAQKYEKAKFGGLKIDSKGNSVLIGLYDEALKKIE